ncbi:hypothetical protein [Streptomyces sp. NPDC086989]|uniref:hypothetical protein n=1 Tax=Streptomyces sp. NPDC086989 TaxID=3365764 RepID=UPI003804A7E6
MPTTPTPAPEPLALVRSAEPPPGRRPFTRAQASVLTSVITAGTTLTLAEQPIPGALWVLFAAAALAVVPMPMVWTPCRCGRGRY